MHQTSNGIPLNGQIVEVLRKSGLGEREIEVFIFLNRKGPQKGTHVAKQLKMNRGQVYRILNSLVRRSFVEATLERPKIFIPVPFKRVIDSFIQLRKDEFTNIEESKQNLISDWEKISQVRNETHSEKFSVIEGNRRILLKMSQMLEKTKKCFSIALSFKQILKADHHGIFDPSIRSRRPGLEFRILTQAIRQNLKALKILQKELGPLGNFKGIDTSLGTLEFSKMVLMDDDEIALFISKDDVNPKDEVILCTNSKSIISAFSNVFEELWNNSRDIKEIIVEIERGKNPFNTQIIKEPTEAIRKYNCVLETAKKEILFVTSSEGSITLNQEIQRRKKLFENGTKLRVMFPITTENLEIAQHLLGFCEVRHIPLGYLDTTIVDDNHLFHFNSHTDVSKKLGESRFKNIFYTNDAKYIQKTKKMIDEIWMKTRLPQSCKFDQDLFSSITQKQHLSFKKCNTNGPAGIDYVPEGKITKKDIDQKFNQIKEKMSYDSKPSKWSEILFFLGNRAYASIFPPNHFGLPKIIIGVFQNIEASTFGASNILKVYVKQKEDRYYHLVAHVEDNPEAIPYRKKIFKDMLTEKNVILLRKDQLIIKKYGKCLFAGWTIPIPLIPSEYILPPSSILFEGYGEIRSGVFYSDSPSGRRQEAWFNNMDAFVTYFHPSSKYIGSGTEGFLDIDSVQISHPPRNIS